MNEYESLLPYQNYHADNVHTIADLVEAQGGGNHWHGVASFDTAVHSHAINSTQRKLHHACNYTILCYSLFITSSRVPTIYYNIIGGIISEAILIDRRHT